MTLAADRAVEYEKYARCYTEKNYRMGAARMVDAVRDLESLPCRGSYIDVSCGCGEMLKHADALGFEVMEQHGHSLADAPKIRVVDGLAARVHPGGQC